MYFQYRSGPKKSACATQKQSKYPNFKAVLSVKASEFELKVKPVNYYIENRLTKFSAIYWKQMFLLRGVDVCQCLKN